MHYDIKTNTKALVQVGGTAHQHHKRKQLGLIKTLQRPVSAREGGSGWVAELFAICTPSLIPRWVTPTQVSTYEKGLHELWPHVWLLVSTQQASMRSFLWLSSDSSSAPAKSHRQIFWVILQHMCTCVMGEETTRFSKWNKLGFRLFFFLASRFKLR